MNVRRAITEDWPLVRAARLQALQDEPGVFGASHEREATLSAEDWHGRLTNGAWFVADADGVAHGVVAGVQPPYIAQDERMLVAMWVAAEQRGTGLAQRLVEALVQWAAADDAAAVVLSVTEGNESARRLYMRCGFVPTGEWSPLEGRPPVQLEHFRLVL